ncbi:hypothetical protein [Marinospirillum perlucidum]|uniref:hypothetical protein n=1 Tax=Marinospirillum perlucidum TaxID=1982602 RepID=UPI00138FFF88|nr:hypothetical protein [Marinospirillum perlucidum]
MSGRFLLALVMTGLLTLVASSQAVAENSHALGYDVLRQVDQSVDGGQVNLNYQLSLGRRSGLVLGLASGDDFQVAEVAFKRYNEKYLSGTFFQLGAAYWDNGEEVSELVTDLRLGYELPLTPWMVASAAISGIYGLDHPMTGKSGDPLFRPHLGVMIHF